jgi:hypothetical protein
MCGAKKRRRLMTPNRRADRHRDVVEKAHSGGVVGLSVAGQPQIEKTPATVSIGEDHGRDIGNAEVPQHLSPHQAGGQHRVQQAHRRRAADQRGPPVRRGEVLEPDQLRQPGQARHVGERGAAHRGRRVRQQPHVGIEVDDPADLVQDRRSHRPLVQG